MANSTSTITLKLVAADLASGKISKAISGIDKLSQRSGLAGNIVQGMGMQFGMMLNPLTLMATGMGVATRAIGDSIRAASDLEESQAKVGEVFTMTADDIRDWADDSARAFGLSEQAALEAAGTFGNFIQALGSSETAASEMSRTLVTLSADLASFNNQSIDEVLVALRSGLAGEAEPMRRLGADITVARLEADALAKGIQKVNGKLTESQKVQLRYEAILKDTSKAQGDFERTSDGLANKQRILAAEMEDALAQLGESLLPVAAALTSLGADILPDLSKRFADVQDELGPVVELLDRLPDELIDAAVRVFTSDMGPVIGTVQMAGDALGLMGDEAEEAAEDIAKVPTAYESMIASLSAAQAPKVKFDPFADIGKAIDPRKMLQGLKRSLGEANAEMDRIIAEGGIKDKQGRDLTDVISRKYQRLLGKVATLDTVEGPAGKLAKLYVAQLGTEILGKEDKLATQMESLGLNTKDDFITGGTLSLEEVVGMYAKVTETTPQVSIDTSKAEAQITSLENEWATAFGSGSPRPSITKRPGERQDGAYGATYFSGDWGYVGERGLETIRNVGGVTTVEPVSPFSGGPRGGITVNVAGDIYGVDDLAARVGPAITRWQRGQGVA